MKRAARTKAWLVGAALALGAVGLASAAESAVTVELRSGEKVSGTLVGFRDGVYQVRSGASVREVREAEIRRIVFAEESEDAGAPKLCPTCGEPGTGERCARDGTPLESARVVLFERTLAALAKGHAAGGLPNPFASLVRPDGSIDLAALESEVAALRRASRRVRFGPAPSSLPIEREASAPDERAAIARLRKIYRAEKADYGWGFYTTGEGLVVKGLLDDHGAWRGYRFAVHTPENHKTYCATAAPVTSPSPARTFVLVSSGTIYATKHPQDADGGTFDPRPDDEVVDEHSVGMLPPLTPDEEPVAASVLPATSELPRGLRVLESVVLTSPTIDAIPNEGDVEKKKRELYSDLASIRTVRYGDGCTSQVTVRVYEPKADEARAALELYRFLFAARTAGSARLLSLEPLFVSIEDEGLAFPLVDALAAQIEARLEAVGAGPVTRETLAPKDPLQPSLFHVPASAIPANVLSVEPTLVLASQGKGDATAPAWTYHTTGGSARIEVYLGDDKPHTIPALERLADRRTVWIADEAMVALATEGDVDAGTLGWLEWFVGETLERHAETRGARRIEGSELGGSAPAPSRATKNYVDKVREVARKLDEIQKAVALFRYDLTRYPVRLEELFDRRVPNSNGLWKGPYLEGAPPAPVDPWGHPYVLERRPGDEPYAMSYGADGKLGGEGEDQDLDTANVHRILDALTKPEAKTPEPAPSPSPTPSSSELRVSAWARVPIGSTFEQEATMDLSRPVATHTETTTRYTLLARTDDAATIRVQTTSSAGALPAREETQDLHEVPVGLGSGSEKLGERDESITVPAGTFACHYTKVRSKMNDLTTTAEVWIAKDVPVPVKAVAVTESRSIASTATIVLTKIEKK